MTRTVPGVRAEEGVVSVPAPGPAHPQHLQDWPDNLWHAPLRAVPLPSLACLQYGVSWHTEMFCSKQSLPSYVHLGFITLLSKGHTSVLKMCCP